MTVRDSWNGWSQKTPESALPEIEQPEDPSQVAMTVTCFGQPAEAQSSLPEVISSWNDTHATWHMCVGIMPKCNRDTASPMAFLVELLATAVVLNGSSGICGHRAHC